MAAEPIEIHSGDIVIYQGHKMLVQSVKVSGMVAAPHARLLDLETGEPVDGIVSHLLLNLPSLTCARCGHTWTPRSASKPKQCPHCKQTGWDHPARSR